MSTCKVHCVNILCIYLLQDGFAPPCPPIAYLGLEFHFENSNVRIGTTIQKRRDNKFLLKDSKILGSESNFHFSSRGRKYSGGTKKLSSVFQELICLLHLSKQKDTVALSPVGGWLSRKLSPKLSLIIDIIITFE